MPEPTPRPPPISVYGSPSPQVPEIPEALTAEQAKSALLTVPDLPKGWHEVPANTPSEARLTPASCRDVLRPQDGVPQVAVASVDFQLDKDGPRLAHSVVSSKEDLTGFLDRLRHQPADGQRSTTASRHRPAAGVKNASRARQCPLGRR